MKHVIVLLTNTDYGSSGTYAPVAQAVEVGINPSAIAFGEFNQQPGLDIAVANAGSNNVFILANNGTGTFSVFDTDTVPQKVHEMLLESVERY